MRRLWSRVAGGTAAACAAAGLAAGCSSSGGSNGEEHKSAAHVLADAKQALAKVTTVHVLGRETEQGQLSTLDLRFRNGVGATGTADIQGSTLSIVKTADALYLAVRGGPLAAGFAAAHGRFVKLPVTGPEASSLASLTDLGSFASTALTPSKLDPAVRTGRFGGHRAVVLSDATDGSTLYVSDTGAPVPLQVSSRGVRSGTVSFTDYGAPVTLTAPAGAVDANTLGGTPPPSPTPSG